MRSRAHLNRFCNGLLLLSVALNDYSSGKMRSFDVTSQHLSFEHSSALEAASLDNPRLIKRSESKLKPSGIAKAEALNSFHKI